MHRLVLLAPLVTALLTACSDGAPPSPAGVAAASASTPVTAPAAAPNVLELTLDGKSWKADRELFGAVDPPGYTRTVLMAGSFGPKNANEQTFNLNVANVDKPGRYVVRSSEASVGNAAQLANLSPERYLVGGVLGYEITVDIAVAQKNPTRIEARFSGTLIANDGAKLVVADGRFHYSE